MTPLSSWLVIGAWLIVSVFIGLGLAYFIGSGDE